MVLACLLLSILLVVYDAAVLAAVASHVFPRCGAWLVKLKLSLAALALPFVRVVKPIRRPARKVGRNQPCPCGSGKKYKKCHGRAD